MIFRSKRAIGKISRSSASTRYTRGNGQTTFLKKIGLFVLKYGTISGAIGIVIVSAVILYFSRQLPDIESISTYIPAETTKIYSADGVILAELHQEENRI